MPEIFVANEAELADGDRRIVSHEGAEVGIFRWGNSFFAYSNVCLHQGGPACEGLIMHQVEDVLGPDKTWIRQKFSKDVAYFACPWHGYEYNIKTGECAADPKLRLKSFPVIVRAGEVYVVFD